VVQELQRGDPQRVGPYRLVGRLGSGGMGRVFVGRSAGGRLVAVKVIRDELAADPDFRMRFGREVAAARRVGGLFTALVVDADVDSPTPWLATVYVAGPSLADAVSKSGPLPLESVLSLAAGLAEGLREIHAVGLVHRDLKPSNVLLADDGPRVIDFGISRAAEASVLTRTGLVVGSPGFMSPEQAEGGEVGPASDVFSLGAVLVFAATGVSPFGTGSTAALVYRVVHSPPRLDDVPPQVRPIAERCLAKDPGQRPAPAELLAQFGDVDLAAAWLPTRVLDGVALHAPSAPASIDSSPRYVPTEHVAQPSSPTAAPDAPHTVTAAPRYQPGEPSAAQPPPAAKAAQPQALEPHPAAAPSADESTVAPQPTTPAAPSAERPPIRRGTALGATVLALLAGVTGLISQALAFPHVPQYAYGPIEYAEYVCGLAVFLVAVAVAVAALMQKYRLIIIAFLIGMWWLAIPYLAANITLAKLESQFTGTGRIVAIDLGLSTANALGVIAVILLMVAWHPAANMRRAPQVRVLPVTLLSAVVLSQIADFIYNGNLRAWISFQLGPEFYVKAGAGILAALAVAWYAMSLQARALGGAVVLGWATATAILLIPPLTLAVPYFYPRQDWWLVIEYVLLVAVVVLAIIYMRGPDR
jgi:serine/threonine protein kinase